MRQVSDRVGTVTAVNWDGTVNVSWGAGLTSTSLPAVTSYVERAAGDRVLVARRGLQWVVQGPAGSAAGAPTLSTEAPPAGQGWVTVSPGESVRVDPMTGSLERWVIVPTVAPGQGTPGNPEVTEVSATQYGWYQANVLQGYEWLEQGTPTTGARSGIAVFGAGAWSFMTGKTVLSLNLTVHRRAVLHGPAGQATASLWLTTSPTNTPPATISSANFLLPGPPISLQRNETSRPIALPLLWGTRLRTGTAQGVGIQATSPHVQIDQVTITVAYY